MQKFSDKFIHPGQVSDQWGLNLVVYGQPGVGKTMLAASAQDSELGRDVLIIDVEAGSRSIQDREDIRLFVPRYWEDFVDVINYLREEEHTFNTVVIDTLSAAQTELATPFIAKGPTPSQNEWGLINAQIIKMVRAFKQLAVQTGINIVFNCHEREEKDEGTGKVLIRPDLTPGACRALVATVDAVARYTYVRGVRTLHFLSESDRFLAKFRQPLTGEQFPMEIEDPTMEMLLQYVRSRRDGRVDVVSGTQMISMNDDIEFKNAVERAKEQ